MPLNLTVNPTVKSRVEFPREIFRQADSQVDGKFLRSQAIRRTGGPRFVIRCARQWKGRGRDNLPLVDLWNTIINGGLSERRSTRCDRRQ
jgi:hypothetical protein